MQGPSWEEVEKSELGGEGRGAVRRGGGDGICSAYQVEESNW
jgi:hypothetical protein